MEKIINEVPLKKYLKQFFGFNTFKGKQEEIIKNLLNKKNTFVIMPTGGGKSLCYQLPALILDGTAIIVSPLIALMKNQVDNIRGFSEEDGVAHFLNSSLNKMEIQKVKDDISSGKTKMLFVAPESLAKEENISFLQHINVSFVAIDEAHCISEWGHDFRPEYRRLRPIIDNIGDVPIIALTATATPKVQHDIQKNLKILDATIFKMSFNRPNLYYEVRPKKNVNKEILKFIKENHGKSGIVYCLSRKKVEEFAEFLQVNGIKAVPYHAGLDSSVRTLHQDKFLMEEVDVIVATIAFGMGIDKPDIRYVIHYNIPKSLEGYYQETGRCGRDGGEGKCIAFYSYKDIEKLETFLQGKPVAEQEIGKQLLMDVVTYAESSICRRKQLLHYFGEKFEVDNCENCDNCFYPKEPIEAKEDILLALDVILKLKEKFKMKYIVDIICGKTNSDIRALKHDKLDFFGIAEDDDEKDMRYWQAVIRQSIVEGLIEKDIENYGLLKISKKGHEYIKKPYPFTVYKERDFTDVDDDDDMSIMNRTTGSGAADEVLFKMLKDLRRKVAKKHNLPPDVIFQDPSLEEMATLYPINLDELKNIWGVGPGKAKRYGKEFVELIDLYVKENNIERPQDMIVKSTGSRSGLKISIIQSIDRKIPLEDIAQSKGLTMDELLTEIENIVNAGTKLNLDYYINDVIDDERQEEVFEYFRESESIQDAITGLGEDDYSEEDIRLLKIKFLCDMGM